MPRPPILWTYIRNFIGTTFHHISNRQFGISTSPRAGVNGSRIFTAMYSAPSGICTYAAHNNRSDAAAGLRFQLRTAQACVRMPASNTTTLDPVARRRGISHPNLCSVALYTVIRSVLLDRVLPEEPLLRRQSTKDTAPSFKVRENRGAARDRIKGRPSATRELRSFRRLER